MYFLDFILFYFLSFYTQSQLAGFPTKGVLETLN